MVNGLPEDSTKILKSLYDMDLKKSAQRHGDGTRTASSVSLLRMHRAVELTRATDSAGW